MIYAYHKNPEKSLSILPNYEVSSVNINTKYNTNYTYDKYCELKKLVYDEIHEKKIPLHWSTTEIAYNAFILTIYFGLWTYCFWNAIEVSYWWMVLLSFMSTGIGNLIFHEACHYSCFKNQTFNRYLTMCIYPIMTEKSWKHTHNYKHHCFTNTEHDVDFSLPFLRHSNKQQHHTYNRLQNIYSLLLFGMSALERVVINGIRPNQYNYVCLFLMMCRIGVYKILLWSVLCGFLFAFIAQLSHIQHECVHNDVQLKNDFLYNQVSSSMNYKTNNPIIRFICFSLDIQIEHHLFPNIPHSSIRKIQHIVRDYCNKNGIPYIEQPSIFHSLYLYIRYLYNMGNP